MVFIMGDREKQANILLVQMHRSRLEEKDIEFDNGFFKTEEGYKYCKLISMTKKVGL